MSNEPFGQGEVYKIAKQEELPLTVYVQSKKNPSMFDWYRIPSWPVRFLGFEEFDFRVHRPTDFIDGWVVSEATTGMAIVKEQSGHDPETPCISVGWLISQGKMTPENLREAIAKGKERLAELGLTERTK